MAALQVSLFLGNTSAEEAPKDFKSAAQILKRECISCHGTDLQMGELRLDRRDDAMLVIEPGKSDESLLFQRLDDETMGILMPPSFDLSKLPQNDIDTLKAWIDAGAPWPEGTTLTPTSIAPAKLVPLRKLHAHLRNAEFKQARQLLTSDPTLIHLRDEQGLTALHVACLYADSDFVAFLIDHGATVNARSEFGITPLMLACHDLRMTEKLLAAGADASAVTSIGRSTLEIAASYSGNADVIDRLLAATSFNAETINKALQQAVCLLDQEMVDRLIAAGGIPGADAMTDAGRSAEMPFIETLLRAVGKDARQAALDAALRGAALDGADKNLQALLRQGANPQNALAAAAYTDFSEAATVRSLLEAGADPDQSGPVIFPDKKFSSPVALAKRSGNPEVIRLLTSVKSVSPQPDTPARPANETASTGNNHDADHIKAAVTRSVALLQSCDERFFLKTGCLACHQQSITAIAVGQARLHGLQVDESAAQRELDLVRVALKNMRPRRLQRLENPFAQPATIGFYALAFDAQGYEPDESTDAMIIDMAGRQTAEGSWIAFTHRPPVEFSKIKSTAFAVKAMQLYGPPSYRDRFQQRIEKARDWLIDSLPNGNEEEVFRLLGLVWSKSPSEQVQAQRDRLLALQRNDGGWKQRPHLPTDAYATSMAMYALAEAGLDTGSAPYRKGISFLMDTQQPDGSWHVKSRSEPVQKPFDSGFPYVDDQWISATATGWSCVVLLKSLQE